MSTVGPVAMGMVRLATIKRPHTNGFGTHRFVWNAHVLLESTWSIFCTPLPASAFAVCKWHLEALAFPWWQMNEEIFLLSPSKDLKMWRETLRKYLSYIGAIQGLIQLLSNSAKI